MKMGMAGGGRHGGGGASPFGGPAGPFSAGGGSIGGFEFTFVGGGNPFMHMGGGGPSMYGSSRCHYSCSTAQTVVLHTSSALSLRLATSQSKPRSSRVLSCEHPCTGFVDAPCRSTVALRNGRPRMGAGTPVFIPRNPECALYLACTTSGLQPAVRLGRII